MQGKQRITRQQSDTVMAFLAVEVHVIAQRFDFRLGKLLVRNLGFLKTDHVRLMFVDQRRQLMRSSAQTIDVERDDFHKTAVLSKNKQRC